MKELENIRNLRIHDNDKYLALLFAPADKKTQLAALFNFHYEISQIPLEVSEPMVGMIKLQWWRDCLEEIRTGKPPRPHPILLGLQHSNANYNQLEIVINFYEKLLEDWQPHGFEELEEFIVNTQLIIFEQAANILETTCPENAAKAYSYTYLARKLTKNAKAYGKFAADPAILAKKLVEESIELLPNRKSVFNIITRHYNQNLKAKRWGLLLKLAFSRASML